MVVKKYSNLQKEVLIFYRHIFKAFYNNKSIINYAQSEFKKNTSIKKTEFEQIEYLLAKGKSLFSSLKNSGVKDTYLK